MKRTIKERRKKYQQLKNKIREVRIERDITLRGVDTLTAGQAAYRNNRILYNKYFRLEKELMKLNKRILNV